MVATTDLDLVPVVPLDGVDSDRDVRDRGDVSVMCLYPSPHINRSFLKNFFLRNLAILYQMLKSSARNAIRCKNITATAGTVNPLPNISKFLFLTETAVWDLAYIVAGYPGLF